MDLNLWREFIAFSQYMNISETAKHLHISQPTLSNHLAALERDLDATLFLRERPLRLTPAGRQFITHAVEVLEAYDKTMAAVKEAPREGQTLTVFFNDGPSCCLENFRSVANHFLADHPSFDLLAARSFERSAFDILQDSAIDCAIAYMAPLQRDIDAGIRFERIPISSPSRIGLWMVDTHPLAKQKHLTWTDCNGLCFPMAAVSVPYWIEGLHQFLRNHGIDYEYRVLTPPSLSVLFDIRPDEVLLLDEYAAATSYYSSIPHHVFRLIEEEDAISYSYVAYNPKKVSPGLQLFLDFVRKQSSDERAGNR